MANIQAIDHVLRQAVQAHDVPGVVAMAATDQGVVYEGAFGSRALGTDTAMTPDTVVWIASMTKVPSRPPPPCSSSNVANCSSTPRRLRLCQHWRRRKCSQGSMRPAPRSCVRPGTP